MRRDLHDVAFKPGTHGCKVVAGTLDPDPYTGKRLPLARVQIDDVLPEYRAWNAGAAAWTPSQRQAFANDTDNLLAVSGSANEAKGDRGPGAWLPPNTAFDCPYVVRYISIAVKYSLPIDTTDKTAAVRACH